MKLLELKLHLFKGVKSFCFSPKGENSEVAGDNASGKTTIADAQCWLLFDKDSHGNKKFEIKTLDENGNAATGLDHWVEGAYLLEDGITITLKKTYREIWTKKRGAARKTFTGNKNEYHVDGVPVKQKDYKDAVAQIASEETFRLLTTPSYFPEQLHWRDRRELLLEVCGDITDEDVIKSNVKLMDLPGILDGRKLEAHKKVVADTRKEVNKSLESIPVKITENRHDLPDVGELNLSSLITVRDNLDKAILEKDQEIVRATTNEASDDARNNLVNAQTHFTQCVNADAKNLAEKTKGIEEKAGELRKAKVADESTKIQKGSRIDTLLSNIEDNDQAMIDLREKYGAIVDECFEEVENKCCPTCPYEKDYDAQLEEFNISRSNKLETINGEGVPLKEQNEGWQKKLDILTVEVEALSKKIDQKGLAIADLEMEIKQAEEECASVSTEAADKEVKRLKEIYEKVEAGDVSDVVDKLNLELVSLKQQLSEVVNDLIKIDSVERADKRDTELKDEEKKLAREYERLEAELFLIEEFTRTKVSMLEEKINNHFKIARFKLFDEQINEGLRECCEVLFDGIPYSGGLNNAARVNVGLDIIRTLSIHYGVTLPVIVDNAEAINQLEEINTQIIRLVVSQDKKLTVK